MARAKAILQSEFPYNIGSRCINREFFNVPLPRVWEIMGEELNRTHQDHALLIHAFVLMSNHYHLIASTPRANVSQCMHQFNRRTSDRLTREGNRINETWAGRHFKCILHHPSAYLNAYKYNYRNPVTAGMCARVEDHPFSTITALALKTELLFPIERDLVFLTDSVGTLAWLNTAPDPERAEGVRFALKRQFYTPKKSKTDGKPLIDGVL